MKTKDVETRKSGAGHVVTETYSKDSNKWIFIDPQWNAIPFLNNIPLNAVEFHKALIENRDNLVIPGFNNRTMVRYFNWISGYLEEMRGFVEGAARGQESDIYDVMMGTAFRDISMAGPACSATAAWGKATKDGAMYIGRNLDHKGLIDLAEYQHIAFYNPDSGQQFVVHNYPSFAGTMSGMNESGIMISSNYSLAVKEEMTIE